MKLRIYKLKAANPQWKPNASIVVAHYCESKAIEMAENAVKGALSIVEILNEKEGEPMIITNTF